MSNLKDMVVQECITDGCSGWRSPEECPHEGKFHADSDACKDCCEDAMAAYREAMEENHL